MTEGTEEREELAAEAEPAATDRAPPEHASGLLDIPDDYGVLEGSPDGGRRGVAVSFGVLTCDTTAQAEARVEKGAEAARSALEMADLFAQLRSSVAAATGR